MSEFLSIAIILSFSPNSYNISVIAGLPEAILLYSFEKDTIEKSTYERNKENG